MQLSLPRKCPDCDDGKKPSGKLCIVCRGSGYVCLVPAEPPSKLNETWGSRTQSIIYKTTAEEAYE